MEVRRDGRERAHRGGVADRGGAHRALPPRAPLRAAAGSDFPYRRKLGIAIGAGIGFLSSLLGIGGGPIHVPALVYAVGFPTHVATATSHFVLAITTLLATIMHVLTGALVDWAAVGELGVGVVVGAQIGAPMSKHVAGVAIIRVLSGGLLLVGLRVMLRAIL